MQSFGNHKKYLGGTCPFIRFCWSWQSWRLIHSGLSTCFRLLAILRIFRGPGWLDQVSPLKGFLGRRPLSKKKQGMSRNLLPPVVQLINSHKKYFRSKFILKWMKNTEYIWKCADQVEKDSLPESLWWHQHMGHVMGCPVPNIAQHCTLDAQCRGGGHYLMK